MGVAAAETTRSASLRGRAAISSSGAPGAAGDHIPWRISLKDSRSRYPQINNPRALSAQRKTLRNELRFLAFGIESCENGNATVGCR